MDLGAAFRADIVDHPADRTPRLIYADWLEDHRSDVPADRARAEFIRAQCAAETLDPGDPEHLRAKVTAEKLLARYEKDWATGLSGFVQRWEFRSGFVEKVWAAPGVLSEHGDRLRANIPLRALALRHAASGWSRVMQCPLVDCLEELEISSTFQGRPLWIRELCESPYLTRLRRIVLDRNHLTNDAGTLLGRVNHWPALEDFTLGCEYGQTDFLRNFARSELATRLRRLDLALPWSATAMVSQMSAGAWPELRSLTLRSLALTSHLVEEMLRLPWLGQLRELHFRSCRIDPHPFTVLLEQENLEYNLERLTVTNCFGDADYPEATLPLERWPNLRELRLGMRHGPRVLNALQDGPVPKNLHTLELSGSRLSPRTLNLLGEVLARESIRTLILQGCSLDDPALAHLAKLPGMAGVQELDLTGNLISDRGIEAICAAPACANLLIVTLRGCSQVTNLGRRQLAASFPIVRSRFG